MDELRQFANQAAYCLADGRLFFIGSLLSLGATGLRRHVNGWMFSKLEMLAWIGAIFVLLSATPLAWWLYALWFSLFLAVLLAKRTPSRESTRAPKTLADIVGFPLFAVFTTGLCLHEGSYRTKPVIVVPQDQVIYVLGDSISAGMGTRERNWPEVWGAISGRPVVNLATPGATVTDALLYQSAKINSANAVVILEIGGNDLLGSAKALDFYNQLDDLLYRLHGSGHRLVMFELPMLPFSNRFGQSQRTLAKKHGVTLIPKRVMVRVISSKDATLDGLHLSQPGHDLMARLVHEMVITNP